MEELKKRVSEKLKDENKSITIDNIFDALEEELKEIAKENGNDSTFGSIVRNILNG